MALLVATWLFLVTHLDTFVVLVAFCADEDYRSFEVLIGHYAGFSIGLLAAIVGASVAGVVLLQWTFLLGLVPLGLGIWGFVRRHPSTAVEDVRAVPDVLGRIWIVTAAGIGLSGENIALFIPFFVGLSTAELALVVLFYLLSAGVLFVTAALLGRRNIDAMFPVWIHKLLVPTVLLLVGIYVLLTGWFVS